MSARAADRARPRARYVEWGLATRALEGQSESGDQHLVCPYPNGVLLAAVDGLGHGEEAALAARAAVSVLKAHSEESAIALVQRCHEALTDTRGVVMSLASFVRQDSTVTWLGVGNVEGLLVRSEPASAPSQEVLLLRGGVVGYQLPQLYASVLAVVPGDTLVFATDGVRRDFVVHVTPRLAPQPLAERILKECAKGNDDALVLVARFVWESR
jgi:hypothetical protein